MIVVESVKTLMATKASSFELLVLSTLTDFAVDSSAFDAFVDGEVMYSMGSQQFVVAKRIPHKTMMGGDMYPVHVAEDCHGKQKM